MRPRICVLAALFTPLVACYDVTSPDTFKCTGDKPACPEGLTCLNGQCVGGAPDSGVDGPIPHDGPFPHDGPPLDGPRQEGPPPDGAPADLEIDPLLPVYYGKSLFTVSGKCDPTAGSVQLTPILDATPQPGKKAPCTGTFKIDLDTPDLGNAESKKLEILAEQGKNTDKATTELAVCTGLGLTKTFAGGDGAIGNPWRICTMKQLDEIRNNSMKHSYALYADLDAASTNSDPIVVNGKTIGKGFTPISGKLSGGSFEMFEGTFDGGGHTIKNLTIELASHGVDGGLIPAWVGLFHRLDYGAMVTRLKLKNVNISSPPNGGPCANATNLSIAGAIAGINQGTIERCVVEGGSVTGNYPTGGFVGANSGGNIKDCYIRDVTVKGKCNIGGFTGHFNGGSIKSSYAVVHVEATSWEAAGFVAHLGQTNYVGATIENCFSRTLSLVSPGTKGGFIAVRQGSEADNPVKDSYCHAGGITCIGTGGQGGVTSAASDAPFKNGDATTPANLFSIWSPATWYFPANAWPELKLFKPAP